MHEQDDYSRETAIDNAIRYGLIAVGIVAAIVGAVGLAGTAVEPFQLYANPPILQ